MKSKIGSFALTILGLMVVIGLGAFGLHFLMPEVGVKSLLGISAVLIGVFYIILKISSLLLKLLLAAAVLGAIVYFLA